MPNITHFRAAQGALTEQGYFYVRLVYEPAYAHDEVATIHTLLELCEDCRFFYRGSDHKMVLEVEGEELASNALTFAGGTELTLEVEHTDERRSVRVLGASSGNGRLDASPMSPVDIESMVYVLGTHADGAEETSALVQLRPLQADSFEEIADLRLLSQNDPDGQARRFVRELARAWGRIHDVALAIRDSLDREHAVGEALDRLGAIIGLPRHGFGDERYRVFLGIQTELLLSAARDEQAWTGTAPNLIAIVRRFVGEAAPTVRYVSHPPYSYTITVEDMVYAEAFLLQSFLKVATWAGVLGLIQIELGDGDNLWDSASVPVTGGGIWGSASVAVTDPMTWGTVLEVI